MIILKVNQQKKQSFINQQSHIFQNLRRKSAMQKIKKKLGTGAPSSVPFGQSQPDETPTPDVPAQPNRFGFPQFQQNPNQQGIPSNYQQQQQGYQPSNQMPVTAQQQFSQGMGQQQQPPPLYSQSAQYSYQAQTDNKSDVQRIRPQLLPPQQQQMQNNSLQNQVNLPPAQNNVLQNQVYPPPPQNNAFQNQVQPIPQNNSAPIQGQPQTSQILRFQQNSQQVNQNSQQVNISEQQKIAVQVPQVWEKIYNKEKAELKFIPQNNTPMEEKELVLLRKNKLEISSQFKGNVANTETNSEKMSQPSIFDLAYQVQKMKVFYSNNQKLAVKIAEFMDKYLHFAPGQSELMEQNFRKLGQIPDIEPSFFQDYGKSLQAFTQRYQEVIIPITPQNLQAELDFFINLTPTLTVLQKNQANLKVKVSSLSLASQFIYRYFIQGNNLSLTLESSDYLLFDSKSLSYRNLIPLLINTLKCKQKLAYILSQEDKFNNNSDAYINFPAITQYFSSMNSNKKLIVNIKLTLGNFPDTNRKMFTRYKDLITQYEKGYKNQIFKFVQEGKWPDASFQRSYEDIFKLFNQFQLVLSWMKMMQVQIIDFQMFSRLSSKICNTITLSRDFQKPFSFILKGLKLDMEKSIFEQMASSYYFVRVDTNESQFNNNATSSIFYPPDQQDRVLTGHVVGKQSEKGMSFYFKDRQLNQAVKQVVVTFPNPASREQLIPSDFEFSVDFPVQFKYKVVIADANNIRKNSRMIKNIFDTILVNKIIELTRKEGYSPRPIQIDLSQLFEM